MLTVLKSDYDMRNPPITRTVPTLGYYWGELVGPEATGEIFKTRPDDLVALNRQDYCIDLGIRTCGADLCGSKA